MRTIKDRIARPASQLAIITIEPLYHAQQVSRWKSSIIRKSLPKSRNQLKNYRVPLDREFEQLRDPVQGCSTASNGYQSKEQVSGIPAPPKSLESSADNGGNLRKICSGEQ
ncbi:hypothetical protein F511_42392 [Dorcoceras hygrometricum]|uniref:Uncharacterized protein n=1 Tax=Dorcoceras hygrometricum TaxID=472368 RepID=A0A2Z7AZS4_9LAMI|nr:hypothetical protein F511_42392 [Dorcoceras hygrometricum]